MFTVSTTYLFKTIKFQGKKFRKVNKKERLIN